ncbi:MAG: hypothetical protein AVO35_12815 [Candidatus Aegiribacteria sp. MLS_C]|jgi:hypothetical protein|nr:MAG: hypothetical protein AVO35_12815 [Candidatus Aegiribacteria sp. MLS_C]
MARRSNDFQTIRSEGGLLPTDLLRRVLDPKERLEGTSPEAYQLAPGERLNEAITQSWNRLRKYWADFTEARNGLSEGEPGTALTNDRWTLPLLRELGFGMLPFKAGPEINGKAYAINRFLGPVPIHLVGCGVSPDRRSAGVRGAAAANPHGLVQEFLNRSDDHLWAIVSNGLRFRILRDNQALSRQSFLEFDLEAMFSGEVYADFVLLWLMAHVTRFMPPEGGRPEECLLEQWTKLAEVEGTRALGELRVGVEKALQILGEGFTSHPKNTTLRDALRSGKVSAIDLHRQLLRVVYRLLFLFVAEDRELDGRPLLHPPDDSAEAREARERYGTHYSATRLRTMASRIKGSRHGDLWKQFQMLVRALSGSEEHETISQQLMLPALGSFLWDPASTDAVNDRDLTNYDFLEVLRHLCFVRQGKVLRPVDYRNLGAEELGGVYEGLLALTPQITGDGARFSYAELAGHERKTSGSYYTPDSLVQCLLDSALEPVVEKAIRRMPPVDAEQALLNLKVCDPAVGSGHFLVGAAHRLARHLARVRAISQGESEPSPVLYQQALRDVIGRCLYGVDVNPMSAELCRVNLWLEALEPGKPLSFLDHHIRVGNSLLGATPELIAGGLPDNAFKPIEGDDKAACTILKKRNSGARKGIGSLFALEDGENQARLYEAASRLEELPDDRPEDIRAKERAFRHHEQTDEFRNKKLLADTWCSAFIIRKYFAEPGRDRSVIGITQEHLSVLASDGELPEGLATDVRLLSERYRFFHWHLAFPEVFARGGFDCVLGNPPWERVKLQEKEWFAERSPEIAGAPNAAARKRMIDALKKNDADLHNAFLDDLRQAEGESHLLRNSGRYPLCGRGDINLYTVFAELMRSLVNETGRAGCVLPTGIATDDTTKFFFQDVVNKGSLVSLFDFENKGIFFSDVHSSYKFCLFTTGSGLQPIAEHAWFVFFAHAVEELQDPDRKFTLSAGDIALLNPNTRTCPIFRSRQDAELTKAIYRRVPVLIREAHGGRPEENPWGIKFNRMFDMSNDSHLFRTREQLEAEGWELEVNLFRKDGEEYLPLYEAKMIHHFDHRASQVIISKTAMIRQGQPEYLTNKQHQDPSCSPQPRYWVGLRDVMVSIQVGYQSVWFIGFANVTSPTNHRTVVSTILPRVGVGHSMPIVLFPSSVGAKQLVSFQGCFTSFVFDYATRQKLGGINLTFFILHQLPFPFPMIFKKPCSWSDGLQNQCEWLLPRILELTYTAWDLESFAKDCGWDGPPFRWDEARRFLLRCELDAAFFHLYLESDERGDWKPAERETADELALLKENFPTPRDAVAYIMDTFPIVRRKDEADHDGEYRTKRVILEIYDALQEAIRTGQPYQTRLDLPPGDPRCCHPPR